MTTLTAGRELDALIAEKVMGYRVEWWSLHLVESLAQAGNREWRHGLLSPLGFPAEVQIVGQDGDMPMQFALVPGQGWIGIRRYSTSLEDAWAVVEQMRGRGLVYELGDVPRSPEQHWAGFADRLSASGLGPYDDIEYLGSATAETVPLAICRAALAVVEPTQ